MNRLEELLLLWQDESLDADGLAELKRLLAAPEARARLAEHFFLTGVVLEAVRAESASWEPAATAEDLPAPPETACPGQRAPHPAPATVASSSPGSWLHFRMTRGRVWLTGAAAALLIALGSFLWFRPSAPPSVPDPPMVFAQFEQVQGVTFVVNKEQKVAAHAGRVLHPGDGIVTQGADSEAVVQMADAVRLTLGGDTMVLTATEAEEISGGAKLVVEQGEVLVEVNRSLGKKRMTVRTPLGMVAAEAENTALHVSEAVGVVVVRGEADFVHKVTGKSIRVKAGRYVVATPDGELRTAQFFSGDAHVWATFPPGFTDNVSVAFSADSGLLAAASHARDGVGVRLGRADGRQPPRELSGDRCIAFSPDSKLLAAGGWGKVVLYETATGQPLRVLEKNGPRLRVGCLAFSPDGQLLATGWGAQQTGGEVELWDVKTGELVWTLRGHACGVTSLAFSPDGKLLASGSWDQTVVIWDPAVREEKTCILMVPGLTVRSLAFSPDGQTLAIAAGSADPRVRQPGEIRLWDVGSQTVRATLRGHHRTVTSLAYAPDGQTLVSGSADATVRFWDLGTGQEYGMLKGHRAAIGFEGLAVALSPDGAWLATASFDQTVKLWRLAWLKKAPAANARALRTHQSVLVL